MYVLVIQLWTESVTNTCFVFAVSVVARDEQDKGGEVCEVVIQIHSQTSLITPGDGSYHFRISPNVTASHFGLGKRFDSTRAVQLISAIAPVHSIRAFIRPCVGAESLLTTSRASRYRIGPR